MRKTSFIIIACVLIVTIFLSACNNSKGKGSDSDSSYSSNESSSQDESNLADDTSSEQDVSSDNQSTKPNVVVSNTDVTTSSSTSNGSITFGKPEKNLNLNSQLGGAEKEAETLRKSIVEAKDNLDLTGKTVYYISPSGDDTTGDGSKNNPYKSLDAPVFAFNALKPNTAILFERGGVYRITNNITTISPVSNTVFGAYGTGAKPVLMGSKKNYAEVRWVPSKKENVWKLDELFNEFDAGMIVFNDAAGGVGKKKSSFLGLTQNGDFYHSEADYNVYLYCDLGNPGVVYDSIDIGLASHMFSSARGVNNVTIDNLCLKYIAGHGIQIGANNSGWKITNCEMGFIGGAYHKKEQGTRYGNAIEFWCGRVSDALVDHNWVYQVYDTAFTFQGDGSTKNATYENITFSNNLAEYNNYTFEFWDNSALTDGISPAIFSNILVENNISRFVGYGYCEQRPDKGNEAHIFSGSAQKYYQHSEKFVVKNNIFDCSKTMALLTNFWAEPAGTSRPFTWTFTNNTYYYSQFPIKHAFGPNSSSRYAYDKGQLIDFIKEIEPGASSANVNILS